jgi:hypothetical protein
MGEREEYFGSFPFEYYRADPDGRTARGCDACGETNRGLLYLDRRVEVQLCVPCLKAMLEYAEAAECP